MGSSCSQVIQWLGLTQLGWVSVKDVHGARSNLVVGNLAAIASNTPLSGGKILYQQVLVVLTGGVGYD